MIVSGSLVLISCFLAGITYRSPSSSMPFDRHAFAPVCVVPHIFFLLFRLVFFVCFSSLGSPATFFYARTRCLSSQAYGCTTLVFDYLYELRAIGILIVHGWREIHLGRRVGAGIESGFLAQHSPYICLLCCLCIQQLVLFLRRKMIFAAGYE